LTLKHGEPSHLARRTSVTILTMDRANFRMSFCQRLHFGSRLVD
jgi:hypothetical protein